MAIDGDRDRLRDRLVWLLDGPLVDSRGVKHYDVADAILDADDILVVNLRCSMCCGSGKAYPEHVRGHTVALDTIPGYDPRIPCPPCHGSGRRQVKVVDADLLRRVASLADWAAFVTDAEWEIVRGWSQ